MSTDLFGRFKESIVYLCKEFDIDYNMVEFDKPSEHTNTTSLFYKACGQGKKYGVSIMLSQSEEDEDVCMSFSINYSMGARPFNFKCNPGNQLKEWATKAVYMFHVKHESVSLESLFNEMPISIYALPLRYSNPALQDLKMIMDYIKNYQKETIVYRFRHILDTYSNFQTTFSYAFLLSHKYKRWAIFPMLGALQGGSSHGDFLEVEKEVKSLDENITVELRNLDIEEKILTKFLSKHQELIILPDINQFDLPNISEKIIGKDLSESYNNFITRYDAEEYPSALGELRAILQDVIELACKQRRKKLTDLPEKDRNIVTLMERLVKKDTPDAWLIGAVKTFQKISSTYGSHSRNKIKRKQHDYVFRKRIILAILLGVQVLLEVQRILGGSEYSFSF